MNKLKQNIQATALKYIDIQSAQLDPLLESIADDLKKLYPNMYYNERQDWATEFINNPSISKVFERLDGKFICEV